MKANLADRAGARAVDLRGPSVYQGGQSLKLSTKATVFKRVSLLIGGPSMSIGGPGPLLAPALLVDLAELQSKDGFRKHYKTSKIISKIARIRNKTQMIS